jgi:hypothetical protein
MPRIFVWSAISVILVVPATEPVNVAVFLISYSRSGSHTHTLTSKWKRRTCRHISSVFYRAFRSAKITTPFYDVPTMKSRNVMGVGDMKSRRY